MRGVLVLAAAVLCGLAISVDDRGGREQTGEAMFTQAKPLQYKRYRTDCAGSPENCETREKEECSGEDCESVSPGLLFRVFVSLGGAFAALGAIYVFMRATPLYKYFTTRPQLPNKAQ